MYLIRLDSAAIWTRQERRRERNSKLGWGNLCFRRKWDLRDSYSHPPLPLLPPPQRPLEPPQPGHGRSPNRNIYRPLSRGRECKLYLYSISRGQINISTNQPCLPVFPAKLVFRKSLKSTSRVIRVSHFLQPSPTPLFSFFLVSSLLFLFRIFKYLSMYACYKILSLVDCAIENNHNDLTAILSSSIARSFIAIWFDLRLKCTLVFRGIKIYPIVSILLTVFPAMTKTAQWMKANILIKKKKKKKEKKIK